jgi:MoaA/NifB/PqqE/SkfB family radical SAM enzyme
MEQKATIHKSLLWDITRRCNLNCVHCYNSGSGSNIEDSYVAKNYKKILDAIKNIGINHIHLLGGEPLLMCEIYEFIEYANIKDIYISINTNGTLLTDSVIKNFMELKVLQITVSLDGAVAQDNDIIRGNGTFCLVTENAKRAISIINQNRSDILFQIATVITKQNIQSIYKMPRTLKSIGIKYLDILRLYKCGNAVMNEELLQVRPEEYVNALRKLLVESYRNGIFIQVDCKPKVLEMLGDKFGFKVGLNSDFNKCSAAEKIFYMDCNGNIYPCGPIAHYIKSMTLGERLTVNIFKKDCLQRISDFKEIIHNKLCSCTSICGMCADCHFVSQCSGCAICYNDYDKLCEVACSLLS